MICGIIKSNARKGTDIVNPFKAALFYTVNLHFQEHLCTMASKTMVGRKERSNQENQYSNYACR